MQCTASQGLKLCKVVDQVAVLVFGLRGHVVKLLDVALPDAQSEDLNPAFPQSRRYWSRVAAVGVAVGDQEDDLGGVGSGVAQDSLSGGTKNRTSVSPFSVSRRYQDPDEPLMTTVLASMLSSATQI